MLNLGDVQTKKLTTSKLFFQRKGESSWIHLGNVEQYSISPDIQRTDHMRAAGGINEVDFSLVKSRKWVVDFTLTEHTTEVERLKNLASAPTSLQQTSSTETGEQLTGSSVQGRSYFAAKQGLSAVTVYDDASPATEGTDFTIDLGTGEVTILKGGGIADGSVVTIDYTAAQIDQEQFDALTNLFEEGSIRFYEFDQFDSVPREQVDFDGQIYVTNWAENNNDYNKPVVQVLARTKPVIKKRQD